MNADLIKTLSNSASAKRYQKGHVIISESDNVADDMFIILSGQVGVYKYHRQLNEIKLNELSQGEFFGEMSLFLHKERTAAVVCQSDLVILLAINRNNAYEIFEKHPELTYSIIKTLCQRLDDANQQRAGGPLFTEEPEPMPEVPPPSEFFIIDPKVDLFPKGHQQYDFTIPPPPDGLVYQKKYKCPLCAYSFAAYTMRDTHANNIVERGKDFRIKHENIDFIHYEAVTCPGCYFTTLDAYFRDTVAPRFHSNADRIKEYKNKINLCFNKERNINNLFAGYYFAVKCASLFYSKGEGIAANIWLRIMWLYRDCGDKLMEKLAAQKAQVLYINVFEKTNTDAGSAQQRCILIGELSLRINDLETAKSYFNRAKTYRQGSQAFNEMAEAGLRVIKQSSRY
jgi:uncharacterized protein (DUF2225 family)